jgi:hypothetical protein
MCRAVWALAVGPDEEACKALRRAAGADVQVIAMATSVSQVQEALADVQLDVAILDARTIDSFGIASLLVRRPIAVVWIGPDAPRSAHATADAAGEDLSGLVTKALLARRA